MATIDSAQSARDLVAQYAMASIGEELKTGGQADIMTVCQDVVANICHYMATILVAEDESINEIVGVIIGAAVADFLIERRQDQRLDEPEDADLDDVEDTEAAIGYGLRHRALWSSRQDALKS